MPESNLARVGNPQTKTGFLQETSFLSCSVFKPNTVKIVSPENTDNVFVSIASFWEISIKVKIGKLYLCTDFKNLDTRFAATRFKLLPITLRDSIKLYHLPLYHKEPFDRILVAQATNNSLILVSRDNILDSYPIQRLWV